MLNATFSYQPANDGGRLTQGEILLDIREFRPPNNASVLTVSQEVTFSSIVHTKAIVITPDCDLLSDYSTRNSPADEDRHSSSARLLEHIQLCDVFTEEEIRSNRGLNSSLWSQVRKNQNERYHTLPSVDEPDFRTTSHPKYFLDFKRMFTIPTEFLYTLLESKETQRLGIVPPVWIHQLIQRYFAFHSRVGVPDPADADR